MSLIRLVYFSENCLGVGGRHAKIADLQAVAVARNKEVNVTGALVYDDLWFIQALEGEPAAVQATFARIETDRRHRNARIVSKAKVQSHLFPNWSMGFATRTARNEKYFGRHWFNNGISPADMSEQDILGLMLDLAANGILRRDAPGVARNGRAAA